MRTGKASIAGAFFLAVGFCLPVLAACPAPGALPEFRVSKVVDGDTLRLADGRSVRLIGLNTPELASQGRTIEPYAEAARRRLQELVDDSSSRIHLLVGPRPRDHYGRTLAHVYGRNGGNFEEQLLADGFGYLVAFAAENQLLECQQAAERRARADGLGIWRNPRILSPGQIDTGGFALLRGRIERVERNRGGVWLEMGDNLVLQVAPKLVEQFDIQQLSGLAGREVEVRGWLIDRSRRAALKPGQARWLLPVSAPAMLEVMP
jgi:endonuclease YncB( thermonuclease family)